MKRFHEAKVCCESLSEIPFEELSPGDSKSFDLNEESPAFAFDTGKSYFKAFRLPPLTAPYRKLLSARISTSRWVTLPILFHGIVTAVPVGKEEVLIPASPVGHLNVSIVESPKE